MGAANSHRHRRGVVDDSGRVDERMATWNVGSCEMSTNLEHAKRHRYTCLIGLCHLVANPRPHFARYIAFWSGLPSRGWSVTVFGLSAVNPVRSR